MLLLYRLGARVRAGRWRRRCDLQRAPRARPPPAPPPPPDGARAAIPQSAAPPPRRRVRVSWPAERLPASLVGAPGGEGRRRPPASARPPPAARPLLPRGPPPVMASRHAPSRGIAPVHAAASSRVAARRAGAPRGKQRAPRGKQANNQTKKVTCTFQKKSKLCAILCWGLVDIMIIITIVIIY